MNRLFSVILCVLLMAVMCAPCGADGSAIRVNGVAMAPDMPVVFRDGVVFFPLTQHTMNTLGGTLDTWIQDEKIHSLIGISGYRLEFVEGESAFTVDGVEQSLPAAPYVEADTVLMAPAEAFFAALGVGVLWNAQDQVLEITGWLPSDGASVNLPPEVFTPPGEQGGQTTDGGMTEEELEEFLSGGQAIQFAWENAVIVEVDTVSGDETLSYLEPRQVISNKNTLRLEGTLDNGAALTGYIRTVSTTDEDNKKTEVQKMNFILEKNNYTAGLYDILPKFSRFTLKNYRLQGITLKRTGSKAVIQGVLGKSPKKYRDSDYARYVAATGVRVGGDTRNVTLNYVVTRDTGSPLEDEKLENRVLGLMAVGRFGKKWTWESEYARSSTDFLKAGSSASSSAFHFKSKLRTAQSTLDMSVEFAGADFVSETAYFTQGKHEYSMLYNTRPNSRFLLGLGFKDRLLRGNHTRIYPKMMSVQPLPAHPDLKLDLNHNYERTTGASDTVVDNRRMTLKNTFGTVAVTVGLGRRKTRNTSGVVSLRTSQDYRARFLLTPKTTVFLQADREKRTGSSTPKTRHAKVRFAYELGEWTDLNLTLERYFNNSTSNRCAFILGLRHLDIETDTEIGLDYAFTNYRDHNDNSLKMRYNFIK